jgi:enoyl-[acyl-carrier protein] reductase I
MYGEFPQIAPLRRHITLDDLGKTALYLCSDLSTGVTGQVIYVDSGFNILGVTTPLD